MQRYYPVLRGFSLVLFFFGLTMLVPLGFSVAIEDGAAFAYDEAFIATTVSAVLLWALTYRHKAELSLRDAFLLVVMIWVLLPVFALIPLLAWFWPDLSFTDAYFEAASALTATGATVLTGLDGLPPSVNLWRGQMVRLGGMGLVVLAVAVLPMLGIGGRQMFKAETPGPMKEAQMTPRITPTAKGLWLATTTGYANTDFSLWPLFAPLWMLFLSGFVSSAGSTGGGIKMMRALLLYKQVHRELVRSIHPNVVYPVKVGGTTLAMLLGRLELFSLLVVLAPAQQVFGLRSASEDRAPWPRI